MRRYFVWLFIVSIILYITIQRLSYSQYETYPETCTYTGKFQCYQQPDNVTCGPTSIQMLLFHYGKQQSLEDIRKITLTDFYRINDKKSIGTTTPEFIEKALDYFGVESTLQYGDINKLKYYVSQGRYPIVLLRSSQTTWHYVVVIGYNFNKIQIADPGYGYVYTMDTETFIQAWKFKQDMDGKEMKMNCPICQGDGYIFNYLSVIGRCDFCNCTGKITDYMYILIRMGEVYPQTMIVPNESGV